MSILRFEVRRNVDRQGFEQRRVLWLSAVYRPKRWGPNFDVDFSIRGPSKCGKTGFRADFQGADFDFSAFARLA